MRNKSLTKNPLIGGCGCSIAVVSSIQHGRSMKQLLIPLAFGLLVPVAAVAQVDAEVASQCKDARDFYGCVRAFKTPARRTDDFAPLAGAMGQVAAGLISGPYVRNSASNFPTGVIPSELVEGILRGVLR
jgi:hypothetical protein